MRMAKYLRSIGYYGSSPFMMCNYGSSEYAQAFSRIGSLYGNVYIVNEELELQNLEFGEDEEGNKFVKEVEINYNDTPIRFSADKGGILAGPHFS
jgi:RAB protein geranylgeranyltransferase component A